MLACMINRIDIIRTSDGSVRCIKQNLKKIKTLQTSHTNHDITYSTDYHQRLTLESYLSNLEQTPLNRSQQLSAPYKGLIDGVKQN